MPINKIDMFESEYVPFSVQILVSNFEASLKFYESLGFETVRIYHSDDYDFASLTFGGSLIMMEEDRRYAGNINGNIVQLRFILESGFDDLHAKVKELGIAIKKPIDDTYYGLHRFSISDPDGYELKFGQRK